MSWTKFNESTRALLYSVACLSIVAIALWFGATLNTTSAKSDKVKSDNVVPAATFPGSGTGAIPDRGATGCGPPFGPTRDVTFNVTGLSGAPSTVSVNATMTHSWVGDINATLIAPNGTEHVIFSRTGATTATSCGDSSDLAGTYNFTDTASGVNWWQAAATAGAAVAVPVGDYRTTQAGPQATFNTSPVTDLSAAFAGVTSPNGTWTLRITDAGGGDTGSISASNLTIVAGGSTPTQKPNVDFDGDGKSDISVVRDQTPGFSGLTPIFKGEAARVRQNMLLQRKGQNLLPEGTGAGNSIAWYNYASSNGSITGTTFGTATTDLIVPADYDGDNKTDLAVWRASGTSEASFYILDSSTNTTREVMFGQEGDNPQIVGDYDGDGKADVAVYRCPTAGGQCFFYYRGTSNNPNGNITFVPWGGGQPGDLYPYPGDFDGDGKYDFCIQRENPSNPGAGQFVLLKSMDGGVEFINWGLFDDFIVPGDYDGDGKSDFMVRRTGSSPYQWFLLERDGGGTGASPIFFGTPGDILTPGDYDGDGKTDVAVWRPGVGIGTFYILRSNDSSLLTFQWGLDTDFPTANWYVQ